MASHLLRALRHRNYRLFFSGQGLSLIGTWITRVATSWLVYRLTGSELLLGVVGFAGQIPTLLLAPFAGVLVDRWDRHRILVVTQVLSLLQSAALAVLALTGVISVAHVVMLQVAQGVINAFDTPARQAFLVEMIEDKADLSNAIALNSTMVNGARIVGPTVAGIVIAAVGEGWCFALDAVSYVFVVGSLLAMRVTRAMQRPERRRVLTELVEGVRYAAGFHPIRAALILLAIVSTMGQPYSVLMPVVATQVLHGGPNTLGWLMTAVGVGAVSGALWLASRRSVVGLGRVIMIGAIVFGLSLAAFSQSRVLWLSLLLLPVVGAAFMVQMAATNTVIQTVVEERMRGRVMAFYAMAFIGTAPIGSLIAGVLADRIGAPSTILLGGTVCALGGAWFARELPALRKVVRPIYVAKGIIPPPGVDPGVST